MNSLSLPISIDDLLRGKSVEWERLEYKEGWNPEAVLHTICAFANDFHNLGGGYILVGVAEDNGRPVFPPKGIDPATIDDIQKEILNLGHSAIRPMYHPITKPYEIDGCWILVIWIPGGEVRPYKAKVNFYSKDDKEFAYYIRKQSSSVIAKGTDERELLSLAATVPFDDRYNQTASIDDFSRGLITDFLREVGSDLADEADALSIEELGRQMNIVGGPTETAFPKNVGLMFFNEQPDKYFPATQIDVVWFPEGAGGDQFEEKIFKGSIAQMTLEALDFIRRNYLKENVLKHSYRAEAERFWNFPYAAIEEAVVNAVFHRSYEEREPIEVRITPEELTILSFPGPDRSISLEDLQTGRAVSRRYRNRRIGEFLKELDLTEGRSTGIPKILREMHNNGSPAPRFETDEDRLSFLVRLPIHTKAIQSRPSDELVGNPAQQDALQVTPQVEKLLKSLHREMSRTELMEKMNLKDRMNFSFSYLQPALEENLIEMTIPDKPSSRNQKYRLTEKGKKYLENR